MNTATVFASLYILFTYLLGFYLSTFLFMLPFLLFIKKEKVVTCFSLTICIVLFVYVIGLVFGVMLPEGTLI